MAWHWKPAIEQIYLLHLLQIPSDRQLCVNVTSEREYYVGTVQAVPFNVYDYYEPGKPDVKHSLFLSTLEMCKDVSFVGSTLKLYQEKNV